MIFTFILVSTFLALYWFTYKVLKSKSMEGWIGSYIKQKIASKPLVEGPTHILFCFVDHYEPQWGKTTTYQQECDRVERWFQDYPKVASKFVDADGCHPKHSFFYPEEEYRFEHLEKIADLCARGFGEIEVHIHHDNDTSENLRSTLEGFTETLHQQHGAFTRCKESGKLQYAFIHGNWCLDNSRHDGRWCGVNDELIVLRETGCFVDMTFPSAPSETQPSIVNQIFYAKDDPEKPKSYDKGKQVKVGGAAWGDLMLITGPLGLNWKTRKNGIFPKIENGDIRWNMPPSKHRVDLWVDANIHVKGRPEWLSIKIHTHGAQDQDLDTLLGKPFEDMCQYLEEQYNDGERFVLHYVSARELYNIVKAAEAGEEGNPNQYRDYAVAAPKYIKKTD